MITTKRRRAHRTADASLPASLLSRLVGAAAWREAGAGIALLPASVARLVRGGARTAVRGGCGVALGLFGWAVALLAGQATVNGVLYPLVDAHDYQHSWGGPTLVGAWVVHALVAVPVVLGALAILGGIAAADRAGERAGEPTGEPAASGGRGHWWRVPLSAVLAVLGVLLLNAWLQQL